MCFFWVPSLCLYSQDFLLLGGAKSLGFLSGGSFLKIGTTMEVRWGWRAVWIGVVAVSFFLSAVGGSESPALKAGQTPASAFEAVKVCHALLILERFVCVGSDVVTNLGYLVEPRFICPSVKFLLFSARHLVSAILV